MKSNSHHLRPDLQSSRVVFVVVFVFVGLLFIFRNVPLTSDDEYYLDYFSTFRDLTYDTFISLIVDEPAFRVYTNVFSALMPPLIGFRIFIFLGIFPHFLYCLKMDNGKAWLYFASYFLIVELGAHLNWVQLRQGLAVGILLIFFQYLTDKWKWLGVAFVGLIHTSMFILLPCFGMPWLKSKKTAYLIIFGVAASLVLFPNMIEQYSFLMGRREKIYLDADTISSSIFIVYSLILMAYVTLFASDDNNMDSILIYHSMCALVLPLFFMDISGAFAERLFFFVRWYEMNIVVKSTRSHSIKIGVGYLLLNLSYTIYHSFRYYGVGGYFDRIRLLLVSS
jgi:hypothetical protein